MRKLVALLLTIALIFPLILAAQVLFSVNTFVLDRDFYTQALENDRVYDSVLSDRTIDSLVGTYLPVSVGMDTSQIKTVIKSVVTREFLNDQVKILVSDMFDYIQGKTDEFNPVINLTPIKTALVAEKQYEMMAAIIAIIPVCEPGQIPGFDLENGNACKPAGISDEIIIENFLKPVYPFMIALLPNELPVGDAWDDIRTKNSWGTFVSGMAAPASLMFVSIFLAFVAISFWYIAALIADDSWRFRLQWLGWSLMIPSALIFLFGLVPSFDIANYWINFGLDRASLQGALSNPLYSEVVRAIVVSSLPRAARSLMMVGGISWAVGLGFIFWGLATSRRP